MSDSAQVATERRLLEEVWGKGNLDLVHEILTEDFVRHGPDVEGGTMTGREAFKGLVTSYRTGLPDLAVPVDEMFEIGDRVIATWRVTGTNTGPALGQDPTGRTVNFSGQHMLRFADGRIAEEWVAYDALGLIQQCGGRDGVADDHGTECGDEVVERRECVWVVWLSTLLRGRRRPDRPWVPRGVPCCSGWRPGWSACSRSPSPSGG